MAELLAQFRALGLLDARPEAKELVFPHAEPVLRVGAAIVRP